VGSRITLDAAEEHAHTLGYTFACSSCLLHCSFQCRRTMLQRYKRPASWELIERVARMHSVPIVGNGDVLTHYEARRRMDSHGCHAVMVGRCVCVAGSAGCASIDCKPS